MGIDPNGMGRWAIGGVEIACARDGSRLGVLSRAALVRRERSAARTGDTGGCVTHCVVEGIPCSRIYRLGGPREVVARFSRDGRRERMRGTLHVFGREATVASAAECDGESVVVRDEGPGG